jgi:tetratricopeptide (TPR) repeat protein
MKPTLQMVPHSRETKEAETGKKIFEDEFLNLQNMVSVKREAAERALKQVLAEMEELIREKKWEDAVALFYPVAEKLPDLAAHGLLVPVREKIGFILGQAKRYDEAIRELEPGIQADPENFLLHNSLAYTAYNSLYAAKNREIFLSGKLREDRIKLAHGHFEIAQQLRPDGVTNFYREGMLYKQLEDKSEKAIPLFQKAVANWDSLDAASKEARHQERKNYIKALFQLAGALLKTNRAKEALPILKRCLAEDEQNNHVSLLYKYYALGKVNFHLGQFGQAKDALLFALQCRDAGPRDFVYELLARNYLAMNNTNRAMEIIQKVPENRRRPYYRWTEADVCCAAGDLQRAKRVLNAAQQHDVRSKHKTLIRLAKIEYLLQNFQVSRQCAQEAGRFFKEKWGNVYGDGLFWQALNAYRLKEPEVALKLARELKELFPYYPKLDRLLKKLERPEAAPSQLPLQ